MPLSDNLLGLAVLARQMALNGAVSPVRLRALAACLEDDARQAAALERATLAPGATNVVQLRPRAPLAEVQGGAP